MPGMGGPGGFDPAMVPTLDPWKTTKAWRGLRGHVMIGLTVRTFWLVNGGDF